MPGVVMSMTRNEMPRCFGADGSVRNMPKIQFDLCAVEVHIFWPLMT